MQRVFLLVVDFGWVSFSFGWFSFRAAFLEGSVVGLLFWVCLFFFSFFLWDYFIVFYFYYLTETAEKEKLS